MARQKINIGTTPNDDTGDPLRTAGVKINAMTEELYDALSEAPTAGDVVTDHGHLNGLGDDDHPQYFNQPRGDARYVRPHTTPELTQVRLNSPASDASHAARAGTRIKVESPLENANGDRLLDGVDVQLRYNPTNFALRDGKLDTIQDIDQDAEMILKSLMLKQGLTLDELLGYIKSEDLNGYDYITQGLGISKDSDGNWRAVVDELTVRKRAKFFELVFQELKVFSAVLLNEGMKVDSVEKVATADWSWSDDVNVFADGATDANGVPYGWTNQYKLFAEKNQRVALAVGDLVRRQAFSGTELGLTQGYIQSVEQGAVDVSDNSTARYARIAIYEGAAPQPGQTFARLGNTTDTSRQGGIYMKGSGQDAPYQLMYDGVDTFPKFGSEETIKSFQGNTKGRTFSEFAELDGQQGDYYALVIRSGFFSGVIDVTGGNAETKDGASGKADQALSDAKNYTDSKVSGTGGNAVIRSDSAPTTRPDGSSLTAGDLWIETDDGDKPHSWNGSAWVEVYTRIDGDSISTGEVDTARLNVDAILALRAKIAGFDIAGDNLEKIDPDTGQGLRLIASNRPALQMIGESGQKLYIGGDYNYADVSDQSLDVAASQSAAASVSDGDSASDTDDPPAAQFTKSLSPLTNYEGKSVSYPLNITLNASAHTNTTRQGSTTYSGFSTARVDITFHILDSSYNSIYSETYSQTTHSEQANYQATKVFQAVIPPGRDAQYLRCEIDSYCKANVGYPPVGSSSPTAGASSSATITDSPATIEVISEYLSTNGFNMSNETMAGGFPPRIYGDRASGTLLGHRMEIEGPNGRHARFQMNPSNGTLDLIDVNSGAVRKSWLMNT